MGEDEGIGEGTGALLDCYACKGGCGVAWKRRAGTANVTPISRKCHDVRQSRDL